MINHIFELMQVTQTRNSDALVELIKMFDPLLKKYSKLLNYDDAYSDLRLEFINTMFKLNTKNLEFLSEGQIVNYISKTIYHHYINQSKRNKSNVNVMVFSDMSDQMISIIDAKLAEKDQQKNYEIEYAIRKLNADEQILVNLIFYKDYSIQEIAQSYGTSRQAINQKKKRVIKKMYKILSESV